MCKRSGDLNIESAIEREAWRLIYKSKHLSITIAARMLYGHESQCLILASPAATAAGMSWFDGDRFVANGSLVRLGNRCGMMKV
jgi:hypothetical protein